MRAFKDLCKRATKRPFKIGDVSPDGIWINGPDPHASVICDLVGRNQIQEWHDAWDEDENDNDFPITEEDVANARLLTIGANHTETLVAALTCATERFEEALDHGFGEGLTVWATEFVLNTRDLLAQIEKEAAQ